MQRSTFLRIGFLTLIIGTLAGAGSALAGFATGDAYLKAPDRYKLGYAAGAIDMLAGLHELKLLKSGAFSSDFREDRQMHHQQEGATERGQQCLCQISRRQSAAQVGHRRRRHFHRAQARMRQLRCTTVEPVGPRVLQAPP